MIQLLKKWSETRIDSHRVRPCVFLMKRKEFVMKKYLLSGFFIFMFAFICQLEVSQAQPM